MPLESEHVFIPIQAGFTQSVDEHVLPTDKPVSIVNGTFDKVGKLKKRNGFSSFTTTVADGTSVMTGYTGGKVRGIFPANGELCVIGQRELYSYNSVHGEWYNKGYISPCSVKRSQQFKGGWSFTNPDIAVEGDYVIHACRGVRSRVYESENDSSVYVRIESSDGGVTYNSEKIVEYNTNSQNVYAVKCANSSDHLLVFFAQNVAGSGQTLWLYKSNVGFPEAAPSLVHAVCSDLWEDTTSNVSGASLSRTYDVVGLSNGQYVVAYIQHASQKLIIRRYSSIDVCLQQITFNGAYHRVALNEGGSGRLLIATVSSDGSSPPYDVHYASRKMTDLTDGIVVPTVVGETGATMYGDNIGVAEGVDENGDNMVMVVWTESVIDAAFSKRWTAMHSRTITPDALSTGLEAHSYNAVSTSRPFWHLGRCYCSARFEIQGAGVTGETTHEQMSFFSSSVIVDLSGKLLDGWPTNVYFPFLAGIYNVGKSPTENTYVGAQGSCNNVVNIDSVFKLADVSVFVDSPNASPLYQTSTISIDFLFKPTSVQVGKAVVISGGYITWYSGDDCFELGYAFAPALSLEKTEVVSGGSIPDGDNHLIGVWEYFDKKTGVFHRSIPGLPCGPFVTDTVSGDRKINYYGFSMPFSLKSLGDTSCVWYRAADDGVYRRVVEPNDVIRNWFSSQYLAKFVEDQSPEYVGNTLYITGGDIEAVTPAGAVIVASAIGRVWLGEMAEYGRIQFSDRMLSYDYPPEFNEGFSRISNDGNEFTCIMEMDDKAIFFTTDSIYALAGAGPDNTGAASDYSPLTLITSDSGCLDKTSVVRTSDGIMFQSRNGIYLLTRGFEIVDIGFNIVDELSLHPNITSAVLVEGKNQVRFTCVNDRHSSCIILVYNYLFKVWTKWEVKDSRGVPIVMVDACIHDDVYYAITEDGDIWFEDETTSYDDSSYYPPLSFKSSHIQKAGQSGWQRTRSVIPFLQKEDTMCLHIKLYADFEDTPYKIVSLTDSAINDFDNPEKRLQPKISVDRQKSQSIQIEIVDSQGVSSNAVRALGYTITGIQFDIGVKKGLVKTPSSQRV